jgi:hypothetical protein
VTVPKDFLRFLIDIAMGWWVYIGAIEAIGSYRGYRGYRKL